MSKLVIYSKEHVLSLTPVRDGETRLGEKAHTVSSLDELKKSPGRFVLLGLPEDIGVRANYGTGGTHTAWEPALKALLAVQSIGKITGSELLVLGHLDYSSEMKAAAQMDVTQLRSLVSQMDTAVANILELIFRAGKIPLVIGGGHNNSYPILKAAAAAGNVLNCVNIDAHSDFRPLEGRHSGNGFSYAFNEGFLNRYVPFGIHESYTSQPVNKQLRSLADRIKLFWYDQLFASEMLIAQSFQNALDFTKGPCGLEIDLDSMAGVLSSASSPVGFSIAQVRKMIAMTTGYDIRYLHLPEGAVRLADGREDVHTAKLLSTLLTDFIKTHLKKA